MSDNHVEINAIQWKDGEKEVALVFKDIDQMLIISAGTAREMAFMLMQVSDHIDPPFGNDIQTESESEQFFGPYEEDSYERTPEDDDYDDEEGGY